jgi:hypothetical protein
MRKTQNDLQMQIICLGKLGEMENKHVGNWVTGVTGFPEFPPISCLFSISMWETGGELSQSG